MTQKSDLVDKIFAFLKLPMGEKELNEAKAAVREEFGGSPGVFKGNTIARKAKAHEVLSNFNGRNATEIARELGVGRATVYRWLKQSRVM